MSEREELEAVIEKALLAASVDNQGVPDIDDQARLVAQALSALPNGEPNVDVNRLTATTPLPTPPAQDTQPKATHAQEDVDALVKAGQEALALFRRPGEGGTEYFDRKAMRFYSETGVWPPGKSAPMHIEECDDALERFQAWQDQKVDTLDTALTPFQKG